MVLRGWSYMVLSMVSDRALCPLPRTHACRSAAVPRRVPFVGSMVRVMPLSDAELRKAFVLLEQATWELGEAELRALANLGLRRRRVFAVRDATGAWLLDAMEGDRELVSLGPEAVWATTACALDRWIAARATRSFIGDLASLPEDAPSLDLRVPDVDGADEEGADAPATLAVFTPRAQQAS